MAYPFLVARWSNLCLISYHVPRAMLESRLPRGLELDVPPGMPDGMGMVSLVAFDFLETRVRGVRWPRHVNFPEINLRFYVRFEGSESDPSRRGVMFIREYVPRRLISLVARTLYNEPYAAARMTSSVARMDDRMVVEHRISFRDRRENRVTVTASKHASIPDEGSMEHWFKEHEWGFGRSRSGEMLTYRVQHPVWRVHEVLGHDLDFDWERVYGAEWGVLKGVAPCSVVLAEGSRVEVHPKRILKRPSDPAAVDAPIG